MPFCGKISWSNSERIRETWLQKAAERRIVHLLLASAHFGCKYLISFTNHALNLLLKLAAIGSLSTYMHVYMSWSCICPSPFPPGPSILLLSTLAHKLAFMLLSFPAAVVDWLLSFLLLTSQFRPSSFAATSRRPRFVHRRRFCVSCPCIYQWIHRYISPAFLFSNYKKKLACGPAHTLHTDRERSKWSLLAHWTWPISLSPASRLAWSLAWTC